MGKRTVCRARTRPAVPSGSLRGHQLGVSPGHPASILEGLGCCSKPPPAEVTCNKADSVSVSSPCFQRQIHPAGA